MILLCNMLCEDISLKHDIFITKHKWDVIIFSSCKLLLKVRIWYRCQNRIENSDQHDGELFFIKKYVWKGNIGQDVLYIARNEEFQFIWQKLCSRGRQIPFST